MAKVRKISRNPAKDRPNYFLVDACFLADKHLPLNTAPTAQGLSNLRESKAWWAEIDRQVNARRARVYIPDIFIAEAFKVLAKKYYQEKVYVDYQQYVRVRRQLADDLRTPSEHLKRKDRHIKYHDLPATRDIIIAVDRFYEAFLRKNKNVSLPDLLLVASAKYLLDFHDAKRSQIHMITMSRINWTRALLGGVVAGVVWGILYAPVHPLVELHDSLGRPVLPITPFKGASPLMRALIVINGFVQGIMTVWLYAAIRPRFGAGPKTAALAGLAVWFLLSWVHITWAAFTAVRFTAALAPVVASLPLVLLAGMAGAWLYKE